MTQRVCIVGDSPDAAAWHQAGQTLRASDTREVAPAALIDFLREQGGAELLVLCLPGGEIARLASQLAGLTRGVLLPADCARTHKQAESLRKTLRRAEVQSFVAHRFSFLPAANRLAELATAGMLGELREISIDLCLAASPAARRQEALMLACLLSGAPAVPPRDAVDADAFELRTSHGTQLRATVRSPQPGEAEALRLCAIGSAAQAEAVWSGDPVTPGTVRMDDGNGRERLFHVAPGESRRLCLACALLALRLGDTPHPALDLQLAGKLLPRG